MSVPVYRAAGGTSRARSKVELPDPLPRAAPPTRRRARCCSTRTSRPTATTTSTSTRSTSSPDHMLAGMVVRHRRRRALHAARPRPGDRRRSRSTTSSTCASRHRLVARRALPVLRHRRRAGAAVPGVAPRARHAAGADDTLVFEEPDERFFVGIGEPQRTSGSSSSRRARRSPRCSSCPTDDPTRRADPRRAAARRRRVLGRPLGRPVRHPHQPRRRGLPSSMTATDSTTPASGPSWSPTSRAGGSPAPSRSPTTSCSTSGATPSRACGSCSATAPSARSISATSRTTSSSAPTRSGRPRCCASVPVAHDAGDGLRRGRPHRRAHAAQADADAERRPRPLHGRRASGPTRTTARRCRSTSSATSTRRSTAPRRAWSTATALRGVDAAVVLRRPAVAARPWLRVGARPSARRRRARAGGGTSTASCSNKRNTFTDTIACAEHLVAIAGDRARPRVRSAAVSAGGLLVGACITMRPDLFAAAVAEVPFVDVVTTMSDPTLPLTITEWEEWGDPAQRAVRVSYMLSYSPYDNTVPAAYPAIYVTAGLNDPRVSYHEPAKWVAKLAIGEHERSPDPAAHRDGRRPRRPERPLRRLARRGPHPRLHPRHDVIRSNLSRSA